MRFLENVDELKKQLVSLGFDGGLEQELLSSVCFMPAHFIIRHKIKVQADTLFFLLYFEKQGADEAYSCIYYDASLRKELLFDETSQLASQAKELAASMQRIEWETVLSAKKLPVDTASDIRRIVEELQLLSANASGADLADRLRFAFWSNTGLEHKVENFQQLKNRFEITQRFYFFDGETQITVPEAYRFLCNRWMEKQMQVKKKQAIQSPPSDENTAVKQSHPKVKQSLLPKNKRSKDAKLE